jgi:Family of unknown function (DUF5985)
MIEMMSGALLLSYVIAGAYFFRFWRRIRDRLFLHFALAFWLFASNQLVTSILDVRDDTSGYEHLLRILGFVLIIVAIVDKNWHGRTPHMRRASDRDPARETGRQ